jgi:putative LPXTG-motif protein cell wall anchor domain protein
MKKVLATILALVMALGLTTYAWADTGVDCAGGEACTHAAEFNGKHYNHLVDAYAALTRGTTKPTTAQVITLLRDSSGGGIGSDADTNMNYVIDFGGHTYTVGAPAVGSTGTVSQGLRVLQTSTAKFMNGTLKAANYNGLAQVVHTYGDVTFENFNVDARENSYAQIAVEPDCGTLNITGNSSILAREGETGLYVAFWHTGTYNGTTVNVNTTGKITGKLVYEFDEDMTGDAAATENKAVLNIDNGNFEITGIQTLFSGVANEALKEAKIEVSGGTFSTDVTEYLAEGKILQKNGDTYTAVTNSGITSGTYTSEPTVPSGYKATKNDDGTWTVSKVSYYYYQPTTDTKTTDTKGSPKTFDAGIALYVGMALTSAAGVAFVGKKRED